MTHEEQFDVATVARDDALLDALGRGDAPPADDAAALLLAAWRDDLTPEDPPLVRPAAADPIVGAVAGRRRLFRPPGRTVIGIAAAVVGLVVGLGIASANAGPDSPLWPITRVVYEDRADSRLAQRDAERAIVRARQAVAEARYSDAARLLDEATVLIGRIRDDSVRERLLAEIAAVRALIPGGVGTVPSVPGATSGASPAPGATGPAGGGSGGGSQPGGGSGPTPAPTSGDGGPLPPLPSVPLPSLPLPTILPTLPGI